MAYVSIEYSHDDLLSVGYNVSDTLLFDRACIPLRKKGWRINGFWSFSEGDNSIGGKISTQHMHSQSLANHLDGEVLWSNGKVVILLLGH